jgi:hypothetical protein
LADIGARKNELRGGEIDGWFEGLLTGGHALGAQVTDSAMFLAMERSMRR